MSGVQITEVVTLPCGSRYKGTTKHRNHLLKAFCPPRMYMFAFPCDDNNVEAFHASYILCVLWSCPSAL
jgi:hypothetical protein